MTLQKASELEHEEEELTPREFMKECKTIKTTFTPLFDFLMEYPNGRNLAKVFGRVWRYCQMGDAEMHDISTIRLSGELKMSANTAQDCLDWLCKNGLLYETTEPSIFKTRIRSYKVNEDELYLQNAMFQRSQKPLQFDIQIIGGLA